MYARDVMSEPAVSVDATATAFEAAELMVNAAVSALPVVDEKDLVVGIISESDLIKGAMTVAKAVGLDVLGRVDDDVRAAAAVEAAKSLRVSDMMTRAVIAAHETATLREISDLMLRHRIKRVPVVRDGVLLGIVSRADLLKALVSFGHSAYGRSFVVPKSGDEQLRTAVFKELKGRGWTTVNWNDMVVRDGVVHLWGVAPSDAVRQDYIEAAAGIAGVASVRNHMHVGRSTRR